MSGDGADRHTPTAGAESGTATRARGPIVVLNRDLMFGVRIGNQLRALGYDVTFARDTADFAARLRTTDPPPVLGIIDMNTGVDWSIVSAVVADPAIACPLLAFGPHLDVEGRRAAKAAGVDRLVSNGEFHRDMIRLVGRYARSGEGRT